ncbi:MAG: type II CAAX prenyl endopeptidase Rce1 family protein [Marinifilaceae bacterium]
MNECNIQLIKTYLKNPYYRKPTNQSTRSIIKILLSIFLLSILYAFPLGIISHLTSNFLHLNHLSGIVSRQQLIIKAVIMAPILEELTFRGFLNLKPRWILFSILLYPGLLIYHWGKTFLTPHWLLLPLILATIIGITLLLSKPNVHWVKIRRFGRKNFRLLVYFSILSFGFVHVTNFTPMNGQTLLFTPLLVLPQLLLALFLSFIRIHFGLVYSILFHFSWNFLITLPALLKLLSNL